MSQTYPFTLQPLPCAHDALEPYIDTETMKIHHGRHAQTYVDNLNKALADLPAAQNQTLEEILSNLDQFPTDRAALIKNNAGGVYNHALYFSILKGNGSKKPIGALARAIDDSFGGYDQWKAAMKDTALKVFGSGWAWLMKNEDGKLEIISTRNQDTPLPTKATPLLIVDVWEHAYYLKYQNKRADYLDNWFEVIDWEKAEESYQK